MVTLIIDIPDIIVSFTDAIKLEDGVGEKTRDFDHIFIMIIPMAFSGGVKDLNFVVRNIFTGRKGITKQITLIHFTYKTVPFFFGGDMFYPERIAGIVIHNQAPFLIVTCKTGAKHVIGVRFFHGDFFKFFNGGVNEPAF